MDYQALSLFASLKKGWHGFAFALEKELLRSFVKPGVRPQPAYGRAPGLLKLFPEKCVSVPIYVSTYLCLYAPTHVSKPFKWQKQTLYKK